MSNWRLTEPFILGSYTDKWRRKNISGLFGQWDDGRCWFLFDGTPRGGPFVGPCSRLTSPLYCLLLAADYLPMLLSLLKWMNGNNTHHNSNNKEYIHLPDFVIDSLMWRHYLQSDPIVVAFGEFLAMAACCWRRPSSVSNNHFDVINWINTWVTQNQFTYHH